MNEPGERFQIVRPARPGNWQVVARSKKVAAAWMELSSRFAGECQRVYDQLERDPTFDDGDRQHPLEGQAGRGSFEGVAMLRWQIDVTSGARVWYLIDAGERGTGSGGVRAGSSSTRSIPGTPRAPSGTDQASGAQAAPSTRRARTQARHDHRSIESAIAPSAPTARRTTRRRCRSRGRRASA